MRNSGWKLVEGGSDGEPLSGSDSDDTIYGGGGNDTITAGLGNDLIRSGPADGSDLVYGGGGNDDIELSAPVSGTLGGTAYGEAGADSITGDDGNDLIFGGNGNDSLGGYTGTDTVNGGAGDDTIGNSGPGGLLIGGAGQDLLDWYSEEGVAIDLSVAQFAIHWLGEVTIIRGFENVVTATGNDTLQGSDGRNDMFAGDGDDRIEGLGGRDTLNGFLGIDTIYGGDGNDVIGNRITTFIEEDGGDQLYGGRGSDSFVFSAAWQSPAATPDVVFDFASGLDHIDLRNFRDAFGLPTTLSYIGSAAFSASNQVRFDHGRLEVNVSGSTGAEFAVLLDGVTAISSADLVLV